jgi:hypothetical protein
MSVSSRVWILTDGEPDDVGERIEAALGEAIARVLNQHETSMVIKWTALIETMDGDGERGLWTFASDNNRAWDTVGMLQHALHLQQSQALAEALQPGDDD